MNVNGPMTTDLFYRTYIKDLEWLSYSLRSVRKFVSGYERIVITAPEDAVKAMPEFAIDADSIITVRPAADDYIGQQVTKLHADKFSEADYILYVDSDVIFKQPTKIDDFFTNGRIDHMLRVYTHGNEEYVWKAITEKAIGAPVNYEYMCQLPMICPRMLPAYLREYVAFRHKMTLEKFALSQPLRHFSEFNALFAYAHRHYGHLFNWIDTAVRIRPAFVRQFRSWDGITPAAKEEIEGILR